MLSTHSPYTCRYIACVLAGLVNRGSLANIFEQALPFRLCSDAAPTAALFTPAPATLFAVVSIALLTIAAFITLKILSLTTGVPFAFSNSRAAFLILWAAVFKAV